MENKKFVVISGGGNRGAGGGGKLAKLCGDYDVAIGISTGSLLMVHTLLKKFDALKHAYTSVTQDSIFDKNPFNKKGNIKWWYALWRVICGKPTLGETNNLRDTIKGFLTYKVFNELRRSGKEAIAGVYNTTYQRMEYKSSNDYDYFDFVNWIWVSACQPPFMSIYKYEGSEYVDGGVQEVLPLEEAVKRGATEIVAIAHRPKDLPMGKKKDLKNIFHHGGRLINGMRREIINNDIKNGLYACDKNKVKCTIHYIIYGWGENDLMFDKDKMTRWWDLAYNE